MKRRERDRGDEGREGLSAAVGGSAAGHPDFACVGFSYGRIRRELKSAADAEMVETTSENAAMLRLTLESRFALLDNVGEKIWKTRKARGKCWPISENTPTVTASSASAI